MTNWQMLTLIFNMYSVHSLGIAYFCIFFASYKHPFITVQVFY